MQNANKNTKELLNEKDALLDKICVSGFYVKSILNTEDLVGKGTVRISMGLDDSQYLHTEDGEIYSSISITKSEYEELPFDHFDFYKSKFGPHGVLEISINRDDGLHNLNCMSAEEAQKRIEDAFVYIEKNYGIIISREDIYYKSIEINRTITLERDFKCYRRALLLMTYLIPRTIGKGEDEYAIDGSKKKVLSFERSKTNFEKDSGPKGIHIKFYDKTEQLKSSFQIVVTGKYLRLEVTLKSPQKIKEMLHTKKVATVSSDIVNSFFNTFVEKKLVKPYANYKKQQGVELRKILKKNYAPGSRTWVRDVLLEVANYEITKGIPLALSVEEIISELSCLKLSTKEKRYKAKMSFKNCCEVNVERGTLEALGKDDHLLYQELLQKLR